MKIFVQSDEVVMCIRTDAADVQYAVHVYLMGPTSKKPSNVKRPKF